jgi:hypothetical protein
MDHGASLIHPLTRMVLTSFPLEFRFALIHVRVEPFFGIFRREQLRCTTLERQS